MHRIQSNLTAWQAAGTEAKQLGKCNETVIAGSVGEILGDAMKMNGSTVWDLLNEVLNSACGEAYKPVTRNTARQRGLFRVISELQEILPNLIDTRFVAGDLANATPMALKSPA